MKLVAGGALTWINGRTLKAESAMLLLLDVLYCCGWLATGAPAAPPSGSLGTCQASEHQGTQVPAIVSDSAVCIPQSGRSIAAHTRACTPV
jgi:hypothetical protein